MNSKIITTITFLNILAAHASQAIEMKADSNLDLNPGITEPYVSWTKRSIHVCWKNGADQDPSFIKNDFDEIQKRAVQEIIQQEFTIDRVGIEFVGWENCSSLEPGSFDFQIIQDQFQAESNSIVKPFRDSSVEGKAFIGEGGGCYKITSMNPLMGSYNAKVGFYVRNSKPEKNVYLMYVSSNDLFSNSFTSLKRLQSTALHEFGHVAGLRHEHIHPEAANDPNCKVMGMDFNVTEKTYDSTQIVGEYDPNSIMNYCWLATLDSNGLMMSELPNVIDSSLYETKTRTELIKKTVHVGKKPNQKKKKVTEKKTVTEYQFRIGLSEHDVTALQSMYLK
jgi:hypothetical protein